MPYITQDKRDKFDELLKVIVYDLENEGELNYVITKIVTDYMYSLSEEERYKYHNQILGTLIGVLLEFYRIRTGPYEDVKRLENGDVKIDKIRRM